MFPETHKIVWALNGGAANSFTCDTVCCKNAKKVWFLIKHKGTTDTDLTLSLKEATDVASGTNRAVTATFPIWADVDHGTSSDTLVRQSDAASYTIDPALEGPTLVVLEWDPAKHTDGYDCVYVVGSGGNASNTVDIVAIVEMKYQQASLPSVIID